MSLRDTITKIERRIRCLSKQITEAKKEVTDFTNLASFPVTGEAGRLYVSNDTNKIYRWNGISYISLNDKAYKEIVGYVNQSGTGQPVLTVIYSDIPNVNTVTFGRNNSGQFKFDLGDVLSYNLNKVFFDNSIHSGEIFFSLDKPQSDTLTLFFNNFYQGGNTDGIINAPFRLTIFN